MISITICVSFADALNILVVGAADLRHVLKTIAKRKKHHTGDLNVSIYDSHLFVFDIHSIEHLFKVIITLYHLNIYLKLPVRLPIRFLLGTAIGLV